MKGKGKISKHVVLVVALIMVGGLIIAFMLKFSVSGDEPQKRMVEQKRAETIAAQIGNDQPESESSAKADIAERDKLAKEKLAAEAKSAREAAEKAKIPSAVRYPDSKLPFETGIVTPEQIDNYQAAKNALNYNFDALKQSLFKGNGLPANFDEARPDETTAAPSAGIKSGPSANPVDAAQQIKSMDDSAGKQAQLALAAQQAVKEKESRDPNELWQEKQQKNSLLQQSKRLLPDMAPSSNLLQEGSVMQLVLLTAIDNTLPGHVSARVTQNIYDSIRGDRLLIPAGSRLEGDYNQSTLFGQDRMMFGFKRIILPSGASIRLSAWNGTDTLGRSGAQGIVNNHLLPQLGTGIFLAVLAWALEPPNSSGNIILNATPGSSGSLGDAAGQIVDSTATGILGKYLNMKPKLTIDAGAKISLIVLSDIEIPDMAKVARSEN
ncbi:MAG TPA: TrbI/VirB10 family protein [Burkholderiales bacterium]|nr:TrbI/VirB10 family protein [Burkholderiales bacterium]